jgi:hypothetical protein
MFMDTPDTLLNGAGSAFLLGWLVWMVDFRPATSIHEIIASGI